MALLYSQAATASVAANSNSIAIAGMDLTPVLQGMVINLGARDRVTGDGYIISGVTPNGSNGGTITTVGAVLTGFSNAAFVIDTRDFNGSAPNYLIAMYTLVLTTLLRLTSPLTNLFSGSRVLALDKEAAPAVSRLLYAIAGRIWGSVEQRTLTYTPTGGAQTVAETLGVRAYPDGTTPSDAILIDLTTGGVDVQTASVAMPSAALVDLGSAPMAKVSVTGGAQIVSFGSFRHKVRDVHFVDGGNVLVHNATSLILPTGASITTRPGDMLRATSDASGNWRVRDYTRADGTPLAVAVANVPGLQTALDARLRFDAAQTLTAVQKTQALANIGALAALAASLTPNGYVKLSNGLILQWGRNAGSGSSRTTLFPVSFPSACFAVVATIYNGVSADTTTEVVHLGTFDVNGFFAYPRFSAGTSGVNVAGEPFSWFAIGF